MQRSLSYYATDTDTAQGVRRDRHPPLRRKIRNFYQHSAPDTESMLPESLAEASWPRASVEGLSTSDIADVIQTGKPGPTPEGWYRASMDRIARTRKLQQGWDSYDADPPNAVARFNAEIALVSLLKMEFRPDRVAPSVEGGIALAWRRGEKYADIEFYNTGEIVGILSGPSGEPTIWTANADELDRRLKEIQKFIDA